MPTHEKYEPNIDKSNIHLLTNFVLCFSHEALEKVNRYFKSVGLENIFKNFLWEKKRQMNFLTFFLYIYHESDIKIFLK